MTVDNLKKAILSQINDAGLSNMQDNTVSILNAAIAVSGDVRSLRKLSWRTGLQSMGGQSMHPPRISNER